MTRPRQTVTVLPVEQLMAHPGNVRDDLGDLDELARSIREHGILQPLTVTEVRGREDCWLVVDGHRRLAAAHLAHETRAPAIIRHLLDDPAEHTVIMLVTGMHRRGLSAVERAKAFGTLRDSGLNMSEIARRVGVTPSTVSHYLNLLHLDAPTLEKVETGEVPVGQAIAEVREQRQQDRTDAGTPLRGRPALHFSKAHPLADVVRRACRHKASYGGVGCGPCWENAIRASVPANRTDVVA